MEQVDFVDLEMGKGEYILGFHLGVFRPNVILPGLDLSQGGKYLVVDS